MQAASLALSNTYSMLVKDKFFESTESALRDIPVSSAEGGGSGDGSAPAQAHAMLPQEATRLRRAFSTGIKKCAAAEKQIDDCLAALEQLEQRLQANEEKGNQPTNASLSQQPTDHAGGGSSGGGKKRSRPGSNIGGAARTKKKGPAERVVPPKFRPPHMQRDPEVGEVVAARIASHELWILAVVKRVAYSEANKSENNTKSRASSSTGSTSSGSAGSSSSSSSTSSSFYVQDIDGSRSFTLARAQVIPLPLPHETTTQKWHTVGVRCLAMYPETTSFYPAKVNTCVKLVDYLICYFISCSMALK